MLKVIAASILSLSMAAPAFAYGPRVVEFDPAAELRRMTGSAQYPESTGGVVREARPLQTGSQAYPQPTPGLAHSGVDMMVGGSARYPVLSSESLRHPPTALSQDQMLTHDLGGDVARPAHTAEGVPGRVGG